MSKKRRRHDVLAWTEPTDDGKEQFLRLMNSNKQDEFRDKYSVALSHLQAYIDPEWHGVHGIAKASILLEKEFGPNTVEIFSEMLAVAAVGIDVLENLRIVDFIWCG